MTKIWLCSKHFFFACKCSKWFIVVLMQALKFCSFNTTCNFYDCNWLNQLSHIFSDLVDSLGLFANILKKLYACILTTSVWPNLKASLLRITASHVSWLVPRSTLRLISWVEFGIRIGFDDQEFFSNSTYFRLRIMQTISSGVLWMHP